MYPDYFCNIFFLISLACVGPLKNNNIFRYCDPLSLSRFYFHKMTSNPPKSWQRRISVSSSSPSFLLSIYPSIHPRARPLLCALGDAGVLICSQTRRWHLGTKLATVELLAKKEQKELRETEASKLRRSQSAVRFLNTESGDTSRRSVCQSGRRGHARKIRSTDAYACAGDMRAFRL